MRTGALSLCAVWMALIYSVIAVQMKSIMVTYPNEVSDSVIAEAREAVVAKVEYSTSAGTHTDANYHVCRVVKSLMITKVSSALPALTGLCADFTRSSKVLH